LSASSKGNNEKIFAAWAVQDVPNKILMVGVKQEDVPYIWGARFMMLAILVGFGLVVKSAADRGKQRP
jgi:hypothetical protein